VLLLDLENEITRLNIIRFAVFVVVLVRVGTLAGRVGRVAGGCELVAGHWTHLFVVLADLFLDFLFAGMARLFFYA